MNTPSAADWQQFNGEKVLRLHEAVRVYTAERYFYSLMRYPFTRDILYMTVEVKNTLEVHEHKLQ